MSARSAALRPASRLTMIWVEVFAAALAGMRASRRSESEIEREPTMICIRPLPGRT
jgi:hypothetical protein